MFFHDVLLLCCRNVVECSHKLFQKRKQEISLEMKVTYRMLGLSLSPASLITKTNMIMRKDRRCQLLGEQVFCIDEVDPKAELK